MLHRFCRLLTSCASAVPTDVARRNVLLFRCKKKSWCCSFLYYFIIIPVAERTCGIQHSDESERKREERQWFIEFKMRQNWNCAVGGSYICDPCISTVRRKRPHARILYEPNRWWTHTRVAHNLHIYCQRRQKETNCRMYGPVLVTATSKSTVFTSECKAIICLYSHECINGWMFFSASSSIDSPSLGDGIKCILSACVLHWHIDTDRTLSTIMWKMDDRD